MRCNQFRRMTRYMPCLAAAIAICAASNTARGQPSHTLQVDASANNGDLISPTLCAAACFAATYNFSTVPYFSLDQPRNVTLVFNSDQAAPRPFIIADVNGNDGTGIGITHFILSAKVNGNQVTFLDGTTERTFSGSLSPTRLIGQFDARSLATNVYPLEISVRAYYADNTNVLTQVLTKIMILNEGNSPIAKGWTVAGIQRLYSTIGSEFLITGGDGSGVRFGTLGENAADFSKLTFDGASGTYTRTYPDGARAVFNSVGQQISFIELNGRTYSYGYDAQGRIQDIKDPYRKQPNQSLTSIGIAYNANGLWHITEPGPDGSQWSGRQTVFVVNANRFLESAQDPDGYSTYFGYNGNALLSTVTDRRGGVTANGYEANSWKLSQVTLPQIPVDAGGGNTTLTNPVIRYAPWQTNGTGTVTDPAGRTTRFLVNRFGQAIDVTDHAGLRTLITRSGILPTRITHPTGGTDTLRYDASGRVIMSHPAGGTPTNYFYKANGLVDSVTGPGGRWTGFSYNGNQVVKITYGGSPTQTDSITYDPSTLRVASVTDNLGHTTSYTYDSRFGNVDTTTIPGGRKTSKRFDAIGRDSLTTLPGLAPEVALYDVINRLTSTSAGGTTITFGYDALFNTDLIDARSNHYRAEYNALGWPTRQCDASSACSTTRYDVSGRVMSSTNRRGQLLSVTRDSVGRVTSKTGTGMIPSYFSYSANGRDMVAWNAVQRDSLFFNPGTDSIPATDSIVTRIDGYRFRVFHRAPRAIADTALTSISSSTGSIFNDRVAVYSASGFLSSFKMGSSTVSFAPDADGTGGQITYPNYTRSDAALSTHLTDSVALNTSLATINNRKYHYDQAARIDQVMTGVEPKQFAFGYDALGRLTAREHRGSCSYTGRDAASGQSYNCPSLLSSQYFTYDAMGNRTDNGGVVTTGNRYVTLNGATYSYDSAGNVTQKSKPGVYNQKWYWNAAGQLDSAVRDGQRAQFEYDAFGRPVRVKEGSSYPLTVQRYLLWDGDALLAQLNPSGQRVVDYAYLPGTIDQPFAYTGGVTTPKTPHFVEQDEIGNVISSSRDGIITQEVTYDAWGSPTASNNNQALFWKGLFWNGTSTGLYYMRNRWYDPEGGRFVSEDPAGLAGGMNLYAFAGNDPVNGRDPSGLEEEGCRWIATVRYTTNPFAIIEVLAIFKVCDRGGGGGGGGGGGPTGGEGSPPERLNACYARETRANIQEVDTFMQRLLGSASSRAGTLVTSTIFGTAIVGAAANSITNTTGSLELLLGSSLSADWEPFESMRRLPQLAGRVWGKSLTGVRALGVLGYNFGQGLAIQGIYRGAVSLGSQAVAFDNCRK